jgi:hypothetical protein
MREVVYRCHPRLSMEHVVDDASHGIICYLLQVEVSDRPHSD